MYKVLWEPRVHETFIFVHMTGKERDRHAKMKNRKSSLPLAHTCEMLKVSSKKKLNVEIRLNSLAEIRGCLFNYGTGVI